MSIKNFHMDENGVVNRCEASIKDCPYTPENHFRNIAQARAAFESRNKPKEIVTLSKEKAKNSYSEYMKNKDIRQLVKTGNGKVLDYAAQSGDDNLLRILAQNPNATDEQLKLAEKTSKNSKTVQMIRAHVNYVPKILNMESIIKFARASEHNYKLYSLIDNNASSETIQLIQDNCGGASPLQTHILTSNNPHITQAHRIKALQSIANSQLDSETVVKIGDKAEKLVEYMNKNQLNNFAAYSTHENTLDRIAKRAVNVSKSAPAEHVAAERIMINCYKNTHTNEQTRAGMVSHNMVVKSYAKLDKLKHTRFNEYDSLVSSTDATEDDTGSIQMTYFDVDTVRSLDLDHRDIMTYMKYEKRSSLAFPSYDDKTGLYYGYLTSAN